MPTEPNASPGGTDAARSARFEAQVVPYLDAAYNLAHWLARNPADAQDVVQEAMLRALRYFDSFHGGDVRVWLLAIVRNTFYTLRNRAPHEALHDELDEVKHPLVDDGPSPKPLPCSPWTWARCSRRWKNCRRRCAKYWCCANSKNAHTRKSRPSPNRRSAR